MPSRKLEAIGGHDVGCVRVLDITRHGPPLKGLVKGVGPRPTAGSIDLVFFVEDFFFLQNGKQPTEEVRNPTYLTRRFNLV